MHLMSFERLPSLIVVKETIERYIVNSVFICLAVLPIFLLYTIRTDLVICHVFSTVKYESVVQN